MLLRTYLDLLDKEQILSAYYSNVIPRGRNIIIDNGLLHSNLEDIKNWLCKNYINYHQNYFEVELLEYRQRKLTEIENKTLDFETINEFCVLYGFSNFTINNDLSIDIKGDFLFKTYSGLIYPCAKIKFNIIYGNFDSLNVPVESLPKLINGNYISYQKTFRNLPKYTGTLEPRGVSSYINGLFDYNNESDLDLFNDMNVLYYNDDNILSVSFLKLKSFLDYIGKPPISPYIKRVIKEVYNLEK